MKCPNCNEKMKYKYKEEYRMPFCTGPKPDYPELYEEHKYKCKECNIKRINGEWEVPKKFRPTEKQVRTILFINSSLGLDIKAVTRKQCCADIDKHFKKAKKARERQGRYRDRYCDFEDESFCDFFEEYF